MNGEDVQRFWAIEDRKRREKKSLSIGKLFESSMIIRMWNMQTVYFDPPQKTMFTSGKTASGSFSLDRKYTVAFEFDIGGDTVGFDPAGIVFWLPDDEEEKS